VTAGWPLASSPGASPQVHASSPCPHGGRCCRRLVTTASVQEVERWSFGFVFRRPGNLTQLIQGMAALSAVRSIEPDSIVRPAVATGALPSSRMGVACSGRPLPVDCPAHDGMPAVRAIRGLSDRQHADQGLWNCHASYPGTVGRPPAAGHPAAAPLPLLQLRVSLGRL
jgi:hypothetical protein